MRRSRFTEEQIVAALKEQAAGAGTRDLCRRLGIATETLYNWKRKYGGLEVSEARRLRALEEENRQLKRIVADQALQHRRVLDDRLDDACGQDVVRELRGFGKREGHGVEPPCVGTPPRAGAGRALSVVGSIGHMFCFGQGGNGIFGRHLS